MELTVKIELEDILNYLNLREDEDEEISIDSLEFKEQVLDVFVEKVVEKIVYGYGNIKNQVIQSSIIELMNNKQAITDEIIKQSKDCLVKQRSMYELKPRKKDIEEIDKENREYFMQLIEECMKKKFK